MGKLETARDVIAIIRDLLLIIALVVLIFALIQIVQVVSSLPSLFTAGGESAFGGGFPFGP